MTMHLSDLKPKLSLVGLEPSVIVSVIASVPIGDDAVQVIYKLPEGTIRKRLFSVEEEMGKAEARRRQSFFIRSFFQKTFAALGDSMRPREATRFEITHVPAATVGSDGSTEGPSYLSTPFTTEPDWGVSSINYDLGELLARATT